VVQARDGARIGVFGIGLAAYWPQFPGLRETIERYLGHVEAEIGTGAHVVAGGLVDTAHAGPSPSPRLDHAQPAVECC